ncbi:hypothetical protein LSTR_LSTR017645 [Laodelphax striatellus]|uniref:Uncharacterized protein n=1 Tax=Laodelphax striatellus TaxID=195883 RepID=A0A482XL84_LAOST|nr:hypothetical protein LSTR_LSTR008236 [Laodelphax striatellus]RZF47151.1 hypothetical protein LSTR_LSTR017645 [Laodelphax striatellus]
MLPGWSCVYQRELLKLEILLAVCWGCGWAICGVQSAFGGAISGCKSKSSSENDNNVNYGTQADSSVDCLIFIPALQPAMITTLRVDGCFTCSEIFLCRFKSRYWPENTRS